MSVRPATAEDVPEIARVQVDTWHTAYAQLVPAAVLAEATTERAAAAWAEAVTSPPSPRHQVLVALEQQWVVGFAAFAPAEPDGADHAAGADEADGAAGADEADEAASATAEIVALLVEPRWGRRGHGSRLLAAAVDLLRADGIGRVVAWLPEGDPATTRFYTSAGWAPDRTVRTLESAGEVLREVRYHASIADPPAAADPSTQP